MDEILAKERELRAIIESLSGPLLLYARVREPAAADDIVQETIMRLIEHARTRPLPDNPAAWLFTVARNESIRRLRKRKVKERHEQVYAENAAIWFEQPENTAIDAATLSSRIDQLPFEQKEVIVAKIWGELSFEEIGQLLGCSKSTAHRRYVEALEAVKKQQPRT